MTDAREYGKALFLVAEEDGAAARIADDLKTVRSAFDAAPDYTKLLDTPALPKEERLGLIDRAFSAMDGRLVNLIKILAEKRLTYLYAKVFDEYLALYDDARGIVRVEAVTAIPLTDAQRLALEKKLSLMTGKTAALGNTVDPSILGGVKLRYQGIQLDGSVKTRLDKFEAALKNIVM